LLELFLPDVPGLLLEKSYAGDKRLLLFLPSTLHSAICPKCQVISTKVHSHYTRIVADLTWAAHLREPLKGPDPSTAVATQGCDKTGAKVPTGFF